MDYACVILNIFRPKCQHAPELRTFKLLNSGLSFEKNRVQVFMSTRGFDGNFPVICSERALDQVGR